ncbi:hypothetical protein [Melittangium boletus]|uniref:Uncharacterized protein n=1 Tax=Melittangium boletus DSM 14713 TaxID=1294270 RepID=A0A250ISU3_9BACT|nr:hypothetical protein [Melittangium boletus]ATB34312.1 hypothetical protein MEBOL_007813 [Melittangium boletus DSM 14713]
MDTSQGNQGLSSRSKALLVVGLIAFFAVDNYYMWVERDNFPFTSHGLFNVLFTARTNLLRMVVHDDQGGSVTVDSGRVIPIEWYRAVGLAENVFVLEEDSRRKEQVARLLLERVNSEPWYAFDETYSSVRPPPGGRFVGLDVVYLRFDLDQYRDGQPPKPLQEERVFSYRLPGAP